MTSASRSTVAETCLVFIWSTQCRQCFHSSPGLSAAHQIPVGEGSLSGLGVSSLTNAKLVALPQFPSGS